MQKLTEAISKIERAKLLQMLDEVEVPDRSGQRRRRDPRRPARARARAGRQLRLSRAWANSRRSRCPTSSSAGTTRRSARRRRWAAIRRRILAEMLGYSAGKDRSAQGGEGDMSAVLYAVADGVATLTLNRPESRNALNLEMCERLVRFAAEISSDHGRKARPRPRQRSGVLRRRRPEGAAGHERGAGARAPHEGLRRLRRARSAADAGDRGGAGRRRSARAARSPPPATSSSRRRRPRSARRKRCAAPSARRSACRASSASASPRT